VYNYLSQVAEKVIGVKSEFDCRRRLFAQELSVLVRLAVGTDMIALTCFPSTAFPFCIEVDADIGVGGTR